MNKNNLTQICDHFNLGKLIDDPVRVHGGLLHVMWKVNTDKASYAIKQISKDIDLTNDKIIQNYNLTEKIADHFKRLGIPAVSSINKLMIINKTGYLVYPWIKAQPIYQVDQSQVIKLASILKKIHAINLSLPEISEPEFTTHSSQEITNLFNKAKLLSLDAILIANEAYIEAIPYLKQNLVISHGDLDQKNVLWDGQNNPYLIDWESARLLNPIYEIINTSLDFCDIGNNFNQEQFIEMLKAYGVLNKKELEYAFAGVLGNWINWLLYNINRSFSEDEEIKKLGAEQVQKTMDIILKVQNLMPQLITIIEKL